MATDEEYLDSLLKSMTDDEQDKSIENDTLEESEFPMDSDDWKFSLDDILAQADAQSEEESADDLLDFSGLENDEQSVAASEPEKEDLDFVEVDHMDETDETDVTDVTDVTDFIDSMENMDSDLAEINGLLNKSDQNEDVDDMLALLEGVDDLQMDSAYSDSDSDGIFDIFADDQMEDNLGYGSQIGNQEENTANDEKQKKPSKKEKKEKVKKKSSLFGGKKNKEEADIAAEPEQTEQGGFSLDSLLTESVESSTKDLRDKQKKPGFFARALTYLTKEEEDEEETAEAIKETGEEGENQIPEKEKKKKKKEKKEKKAGKKKQKGKESAEEDALEEDGEEDKEKKSKAKKKTKKEKKEKPPKEKIKSEKVLSKKNLFVLIAFCATIVACIIVLSTFLPEYADKQNARDAFNEGDYDTAYKLLYDKNLEGSDSIIFNRAKTVLKLERKLQSYNNNIVLNREPEAVDALIQGVKCYYDLNNDNVYGAGAELDALYQQICVILEGNYGITPEKAMEMLTYDNITYTKTLNAVINGVDFAISNDEKEQEEPLSPQDVLSEEEAIIND